MGSSRVLTGTGLGVVARLRRCESILVGGGVRWRHCIFVLLRGMRRRSLLGGIRVDMMSVLWWFREKVLMLRRWADHQLEELRRRVQGSATMLVWGRQAMT